MMMSDNIEKTECLKIDNYIDEMEVIELIHEWVNSVDSRLWDKAREAYYGEWGFLLKEHYLYDTKTMVEFLEILEKILPDSIHKQFLQRYLRFYKGEDSE